MKRQKLKKHILHDNYLHISYKRYLNFKETDLYDEAYKIETLSKLNEFMAANPITEKNVVEIAEKIQKGNPSSGSFVHWSNTADLVEFAKSQPETVSDLWNQLYDDSIPVIDRIDQFRGAGKQFKNDLSLGAPLFGYLLAAYNYEKYPIYKQETFQKIKADFGIDDKLGSVSESYTLFLEVCYVLSEVLEEHYADLTMLDIQDYIYCSTRYDQIKVESAVDYLHALSTEILAYKENPALMLKTITNLDNKALKDLRRIYQGSEKVNKMKYLLIDKILNEGTATIDYLEKIKEEISAEYETNILHSFNNFTIMFQLFYHDKKEKVRRELGKIHQTIRQLDELQEFDFTEGKTLNGFNWNQSFGTAECWLAVYENKYTNHRSAPQLFLRIYPNKVRFGLVHGDNHADFGVEDTVTIKDINQFTYEQLEAKMIEVAEVLKKIDVTQGEVGEFDSHDEIEKEQWLEMLNDSSIFREDDLEILKKMHEMGGEATATQLAASLGRHFSSFNTPVVNLAKRIGEETGVQPYNRAHGSVAYWSILLNGVYEDNNHFRWILKENLRDAIAEYMESEGQPKGNVIYTKANFLEEVFIDEALYDTMSDLLGYKKNIILQGPPGTGKTFVSKRLAFSLMGEQDESRIEMVQFHQNYAYEDFVMGFRPAEGQGFGLEYGVFYEFCNKALANPEKDYYFIIDEINRGNLSKIFGELFMLIEPDKRNEFVTMGYDKKKFTVPDNIYIIGTMNTADRSLAQLEVALRRRFAFITLTPNFNEKWKAFLRNQQVSEGLIEKIVMTVERINDEIRNDFQLGSGYEIGHSFFTKAPKNLDENRWFNQVIEFEVKPLLEEYFFDRPEKAAALQEVI